MTDAPARIALVFLLFTAIGLAVACLPAPTNSTFQSAGSQEWTGSARRKAPGYLIFNLIFLLAIFGDRRWLVLPLLLSILALLAARELIPICSRAASLRQPIPLGLLALVYLPVGLFSLLWIHATAFGSHRLALLLLCVAAHDAYAQLFGGRWGRRRLAPRISPNKTWVGAGAGLVAAIAMATLLAPILALGPAAALRLGLAFGLASLVGDLWVSSVKRSAGIKDFGTRLGPQGGVVDRLDGLLLAGTVGMVFSVLGFW